jgi:hypothetical protein
VLELAQQKIETMDQDCEMPGTQDKMRQVMKEHM